MPVGQQPVDDEGADEAGAAGDQDDACRPADLAHSGRARATTTQVAMRVFVLQSRQASSSPAREAVGRHPGAQRGREHRARRSTRCASGWPGRASTTSWSSWTTAAAMRRPSEVAARAAGRSGRPSGPESGAARLRPRGPLRARRLHGRRRGDRDGRRLGQPRRSGALLLRAAGPRRVRLRVALRSGQRGGGLSRASSFCVNRLANWFIKRPLRAALQRRHERLQGLSRQRDRGLPAVPVAALQPDRRAAAQGDRARLQLRDPADQLAPAPARRLQPEAAGDGQPLSVHRPARLAREDADARRLPARRRRRAVPSVRRRAARAPPAVAARR